jgi:hypothetical protein
MEYSKYENRKKSLIMKVFENSNASFTPLCYFFSILGKGFDFKVPTLDLKILNLVLTKLVPSVPFIHGVEFPIPKFFILALN